MQTRAGMDAEELQNTEFYGGYDIKVYLTKTSPKWQDVRSFGTGGENSLNTGLATPFDFLQNSNLWRPDDSSYYDIYLPESGDVDAIGLFPSSFDFSQSTFSVQLDQSTYVGYRNSDLMVAENLNCHSTDGTIPLTFEHQLAKLVVKLDVDNLSEDELANTSIEYFGRYSANVTFTGLDASKPTEVFSYSLTPINTYETIKMGNYNAEGNSAIVIPYTLTTGDDFLTVKVGTKNYICFPSQTLKLEGGKVTTINVTISKDKIFMSDVTITDWQPGSTDNVTGTLW